MRLLGLFIASLPLLVEPSAFFDLSQVATRNSDSAVVSRKNAPSVVSKSTPFKNDIPVSMTGLRCRGGACSDKDMTLFAKIGVSAAIETGAMLGLLLLARTLSDNYPKMFPEIFGLPISQWGSLVLIIFGSSFFGSIVEGGVSAATNQALKPNEIPGDSDWYKNLVKPSWNPPGWVFPIMWLIVSKPTQLLAVGTILKRADVPVEILTVYLAHLSLGDAWNKVFFGLQCPGRGAAVITAFLGLLLTSAYLFYSVDPQAGKLLLPTCGWVLVASALNWNIYLNNKK